jgi:hypothetical protein
MRGEWSTHIEGITFALTLLAQVWKELSDRSERQAWSVGRSCTLAGLSGHISKLMLLVIHSFSLLSSLFEAEQYNGKDCADK